MRHIQLTKGKFAIVDDKDFEKLNHYKWCVTSNGYASRRQYYGRKNGEEISEIVLMHRQILNVPNGLDTDHINRNKLDNRKDNLRIATRSQNIAWGLFKKNNRSGYRGVVFYKRDKNWRAFIKTKGKQLHLGYYDDPKKAAEAYNYAAREIFGDFAYINQV